MREMRYDDPRNDDQAPSNVLNIIKSNPNPPQYTIIFNFQFSIFNYSSYLCTRISENPEHLTT